MWKRDQFVIRLQCDLAQLANISCTVGIWDYLRRLNAFAHKTKQNKLITNIDMKIIAIKRQSRPQDVCYKFFWIRGDPPMSIVPKNMDWPLIRMIVRRVISGYPASALVTSDYCHAPDWSFENVIINVSVDYIKAQEFRFGFSVNEYLWHKLVWILLHFCSFQQKNNHHTSVPLVTF